MKVSTAYLVGQRHEKERKKCEDFVCGGRYKDLSFAALADGAGGKKYGYETAKCLSQAIQNYVKDLSNNMIYPPNDQDVLTYLENALKECGLPLPEMGSTFLLAIIKGNSYYLGHIGDGAILGKLGESFEVLSYPENGEFINETYFLPAENAHLHYRSSKGELFGEFCFILVSDGISATLYDPQSGQVSTACDMMYGWCQDYSEEECNKILRHNLETVFSSFGDDDKSIAIIAE